MNENVHYTMLYQMVIGWYNLAIVPWRFSQNETSYVTKQCGDKYCNTNGKKQGFCNVSNSSRPLIIIYKDV
jgi:hypothetical protein